MTTWGFLLIAVMVVLLAYWGKGPNAVWGTATVGAAIGIAIAVYQPGFDWRTVGKAVVIGTLIGLTFELLPFFPKLLFTGSNARNSRMAAEQREKKLKTALLFDASLENNPEGIVRDTALLPYPKHEILDALLFAIANVENENTADSFGGAAIRLAEYQDGVGDDPIALPSADLSPSELMEFINGKGFERISKFMDAMNDESDAIWDLVSKAKVDNPHLRPS